MRSHGRRHLHTEGDIAPAAVRQRGGHTDSVRDAITTMLDHLDVEPGMRVLEVTSASAGPNPALCERVGAGSVDTHPVGEVEGTRLRGGYDRVVVTVPVSEVSYDWISAVRGDGALLVPWANPFSGPALVRLKVDDNRAVGAFADLLTGMGASWPAVPGVREIHSDTLEDGDPVAAEIDPAAIWADPVALFALGMRLPDLRCAVVETPADAPADNAGRTCHWVYDQDAWASICLAADGTDPHIEQYGIRKVWAAVESAYRWWVDNDRPGPEEFGMTVASFGQFGWLGNRYSGRIWRL